jgi:hypothetical protein
MTRSLFLAASLALAVVLTGTAQANSPRVSRGDAEAIFQASQNGGSAIRIHGGDVLEGAPVQPGARIAPTPFNNGRHLCTLDWHLLAIAFLDAFPQSEDAHAQTVADFSSLVVEIRLDGAPLALDTTAVKRIDPTFTEQVVGPGLAGYWEQWGAIMSPTDLAVGAHTLQLLGTVPGAPITFFVDPEGSAACS